MPDACSCSIRGRRMNRRRHGRRRLRTLWPIHCYAAVAEVRTTRTVLTSVTKPFLRAALVCGPHRHAARCYKGYHQSRCWGPNIHLRKTLRFTKDVLPARWGKSAQPRGTEGVSTQEGKVQRLQRRCWNNLRPLRCPVSQLRALTPESWGAGAQYKVHLFQYCCDL